MEARINRLSQKLNQAAPDKRGVVPKECLQLLHQLRLLLEDVMRRAKEQVNALYRQRGALFDDLKRSLYRLEQLISDGANNNHIDSQYDKLKKQVRNFRHMRINFDINSETLADQLMFKINLKMEKGEALEEQKKEKSRHGQVLRHKIQQLEPALRLPPEQDRNINELIVQKLTQFPQASLAFAKSVREFTRAKKIKERNHENWKMVSKIVDTLSEKGDVQARLEMASLLLTGEGVQKNVARSIRILKELYDIKCKAAGVELARIYIAGEDVPQNHMKGMEYMQLGMEEGYEEETFKKLDPAFKKI